MKTTARLGFLALGVSLLCGCPHNNAGETGIYATRPQVLYADDRGEAQPLAQGQPLHSGQVFSLTIELSAPAHVYVIHRRGGTLSDLYPSLGVSDREMPEGVVRLPPGDQWMRVPALDRQSQMCVLLSADVIESPQRRCHQTGKRKPGQPMIQSFALTLP